MANLYLQSSEITVIWWFGAYVINDKNGCAAYIHFELLLLFIHFGLGFYDK